MVIVVVVVAAAAAAAAAAGIGCKQVATFFLVSTEKYGRIFLLVIDGMVPPLSSSGELCELSL